MARSGLSLGRETAEQVPFAAEPFAGYAQGRVCELEEENARLRLLVSELLVANQQLRERARKRDPGA